MKEQDELLQQIIQKYHISPQVKEAFRECPRDLFIKKPYSMEEMYGDWPLEIYRDENFVSTISQPSFVLMMIDMLKLEPHHRVLELGAGSGWNAALMSRLCEFVVSVEIIPSLARETQDNLALLGFENVEIIEGDAAFGLPEFAPYDRGVFTAGATDLPQAFHDQIKVGGLLLYVMKSSSVDLLLLLEKKEGYFQELERVPCSFVPMKGTKGVNRACLLDSLETRGPKFKIYPNPKHGGLDSVFSTT